MGGDPPQPPLFFYLESTELLFFFQIRGGVYPRCCVHHQPLSSTCITVRWHRPQLQDVQFSPALRAFGTQFFHFY
jgi:hypothetical protein